MKGNVEIVMLPVSWVMNREAAFIAQQRGELDKIKSGRLLESQQMCDELATLLDQGYQVVGQQLVEGTGRSLIAFVLYKPGIPS